MKSESVIIKTKATEHVMFVFSNILENDFLVGNLFQILSQGALSSGRINLF